jgi:hypothetical protein
MILINLFEIETSSGYKSVELRCGDITKIEEKVDALVVSAFKGGYNPIPNTLLGSLKSNCNIDLNNLLSESELDLRNPLNVWLSKELNQNFKRIICVEIVGTSGDEKEIEQAVKNLFSLIALAYSQDYIIETVMLPFIGTGNQEIPPDKILPKLMELCKNTLENLACLKKIIFVEINEEKIKLLNQSLNSFLKRGDFEIKNYSLDNFKFSIKADLLEYLRQLRLDKNILSNNSVQQVFTDLHYKIKRDDVIPFEIGLLCRKLTEIIVKDIHNVDNIKKDLSVSINELKTKQIASWIISYLHILRTFGNVAVHTAETHHIKPPSMNEKDLSTLFICLNRVLDFWLWYRNNRKNLR